MTDPYLLILIGFVSGIFGSMLGLGGGSINVMLLTLLGVPPTTATSSSLFAILGNATSSTVSYAKQKRVEFKLGIKMGLLAVPGTIVGPLILANTHYQVFEILFAIVLILSALYVVLQREMHSRQKSESLALIIIIPIASFGAGMIAAFFGIGGGIIFVPLMIIGLGLGIKRAAPTSQLILLFTSTAGFLTHLLLDHPDLFQAGFLMAGSIAGGIMGSRLSLNIKERYLRIMFAIVLIVSAIELMFDATIHVSDLLRAWVLEQ